MEIRDSIQLNNSAMYVTDDAQVTTATAQLQNGSQLMINGGNFTVTDGTAVMNDSDMTINNGYVLFQNGWTATGGSTTVGEAGDANNVSTLAEGDALTVKGTATLNDHDLTIESGKTITQDALDANEGTNITVNGTLNVTGNASFDSSTLESSGTTELGSLSSTGSSKVNVTGGAFTVNGATNTNEFYVSGGTVTLNASGLENGGTMTGTTGTDETDGRAALYVTGKGTTVTANNVTFTGGEVAVDDGTLKLNGGVVDVPDDWFTTDGGHIETTNTAINSGVWANKGTVSVTGGSIFGNVSAAGEGSSVTIKDVENATLDHVFAQQNLMDDNGEWTENGGASGGTVTFTNSNITANSIEAAGDSDIIINGGAQVTAKSLTAAGTSTVSVTGSDGATNSHLLIDGNATFSDTSKLSVDSAANADVTGTLTFNDDAKIELTGNNTAMTFAAGSKLYANNSKAPAITVKGGANLHFAAGSAAYTKAIKSEEGENHFTVATVAKGETEDSITFDSGASLYVRDAKIGEDYTYDLSNAIMIGDEGTGWQTDNVYGDNIFEKLVIGEGNQAYFEKNSMQDSLKGLLPTAAVYDAAWADTGTDAAAFVEAVAQTHGEDADVEAARIAKALNAHSGMTGLAGVGYGTYRFTTAFTDHVANHEAGGLWASYLHDKSSVDGLSVGNLRADYDLTYDGAVIGSDFYNNGRTTIGAAFAYADGDVSTKSGVSTKNDVDYYGGMIYGSVKGGAGMTYRAEIGYNRSSNDLTQWNTGERITGSVDADAFHVGVAAEKEIRTGSSVWTPFLGLQYIDLSIDDYSDSLGFRHEGDSAGLWNMPVGVNYKYEVANGAWTYAPTVTLGYRFAFGDDSVDETLRYGSGAGSFGTEIAEDSFFTRIGFEAKKDNIGFGVHYGYERGSDTEANQWGINCSFFF